MSKLKTKFESTSLKDKFASLLEGIDRNNSSKMILERYYSSLAALEVSEGRSNAKDTYADLTSRGIDKSKAQNLISASPMSFHRSNCKTVQFTSKVTGEVPLFPQQLKKRPPRQGSIQFARPLTTVCELQMKDNSDCRVE